MKKTLTFLTALCIGFLANAQAIYSDNFDGVASISYDSGYDISLSNGNLVIVGDGTVGAFTPFGYDLHANGSSLTIDVSSNPRLFIKAKASGAPVIRIDLDDSEGYSTSQAELKHSLSDQFEIYEFAFTGPNDFTDAGYSPACDTGGASTCPVDPSDINSMTLFLDPADGGYNGTVEIEWISFGEPLEDLPQASDFDIRYNQIGYVKGQSKVINIIGLGTFNDKSYTVKDNSGTEVLSGITGNSNSWSASGENSAVIDVTSIDTEGTYEFSIDEMSITFKVVADGYAEIREEAFKYYYYNRASIALTSQYAGDFARPNAIPDDVVYIHKSAASNERPTGSTISAPKGWYDAGDYNKYIVNSGISTYTLLAAYEHYADYFSNTDFGIPEQGGNLPDILDETVWNLDWMLAMQDPNDGGVYHKLTGLNFSGQIMPQDYNFNRYVVQKSTSAALNFAAVTATAARIFADYNDVKPGYSAQLLQASKDAYAWAKANPADYYEQGSGLLDDVVTGAYPDTDVSDEFQWAATELYISTGEMTYSNDINVSSLNGGVPGWQKVNTLALLSIAHHTSSLPSSITTTANSQLISIADGLKGTVTTSAMNVAMSTSDFVWGSNGVAGNQIVLLINAYKLTSDTSYLDAAYKAIDYLFGRNGTGYSYVTGFGDLSPVDPHHRISFADNVAAPVPGMIVGGPHYPDFTLSGECGDTYPSQEQAKSYLDDWCSYSRNEVTINWNAPLVYSLHALYAIQTGDASLSIPDNISEAFAQNFEVFPIPTQKELHIKSKEQSTNATAEIYTTQGKKIFSKSLKDIENTIDIGHVTPGLYLMTISLNGKKYTTKIVKQ